MKVGDRVVWFDPRLWGPRDIKNNEHCYKPATIVGLHPNGDGPDRPTIDLLFDHNPNISHGHFAYGLYLNHPLQKILEAR